MEETEYYQVIGPMVPDVEVCTMSPGGRGVIIYDTDDRTRNWPIWQSQINHSPNWIASRGHTLPMGRPHVNPRNCNIDKSIFQIVNYGGSNGVNEAEMFLVERTVLANSAHSTTLRSKREFRWIGLVETVAFEFIQILCSYRCCKRESRWIGLAEPVVLESIQIVVCVNTVAEMHLGNGWRPKNKRSRGMSLF